MIPGYDGGMDAPRPSLRQRILSILARIIAPMHRTNASGNNMSQR